MIIGVYFSLVGSGGAFRENHLADGRISSVITGSRFAQNVNLGDLLVGKTISTQHTGWHICCLAVNNAAPIRYL